MSTSACTPIRVRHSGVILLGPPGSGKGTQCKRLSEMLHVPHVSTGDLLRDHVKRGTEIGLHVRGIMDRGELVPDEIVLEMLRLRLLEQDSVNGFILDGFPRSRSQAELLDGCLNDVIATSGKKVVLRLVVPEAILVQRLAGRLTCLCCGKTFAASGGTGQVPSVCDMDNSELVVRVDDQEATVRRRLGLFEKMIRPIVEYYARQDLVVLEVNANRTIDEVAGSIVAGLERAGLIMQSNANINAP